MKIKTKLRKFLAIALCAALTGGTGMAMSAVRSDIGVTVNAYGDFLENEEFYEYENKKEVYGDFEYIEDEDNEDIVIITRYIGNGGDVKIPDTILGKTVLKIEGYETTETSYGAFENCTNVTSVTIPDSVVSIGASSFKNCINLKTVHLSNSLQSISVRGFENCKKLTSITIPDSVWSIGSSSFSNCTGLTSITIPDSVTEIEDSVFSNCTGLTSITIPDNVTTIEMNAFLGCMNIRDVHIGKGLEEIGSSNFSNVRTIDVDPENPNFCASDGILFDAQKSTVYLCVKDKSGSLTLPDGVTEIGVGAFQDCTGLTDITIPDTIKKIGNNAFYGCTGLRSVVINGKKVKIGGASFKNCSAMTSIVMKSISSIGNSAFKNCKSLTSVVIPSDTSTVGNYSFDNCSSLKYLVFPTEINNVGSIDYDSLGSNCKIYYVLDWRGRIPFKDYYNVSLLDGDKPQSLMNLSVIGTAGVVGAPVVLNAQAFGGEGGNTYALMYKKSTSNTWTKIGTKYGTQNVGSFIPKSAVKYDIMINVKDSTGKVKSKTFTVDVKAPLKNKTTVNAETVKVGEKIVLKGAASGGSSYKYAFYYKKSKSSTWTEMKPAYTTKSAAFKPGTATDYDVKCVVMDSDGRTAEKVFSVVVTK